MADTTTTTISGIDPEFKKYYATLFNQAGKSIFSTDAEGKVTGVNPFQQYQGEQIAGFTPQQLAVQQQMAQLQTPQGFQQGAQGLNQSQQLAFAAANQGLNQAFGYQPQAPASLAIPQQSWFPSGSNQPQNPNNGNGGFGPPKNEPRTPAPDVITTPGIRSSSDRMRTQTFAEGGAVLPDYWANRAASRANQPAQPDTSHYTLAAQNAEIDPTEQDYSPYAVVARRQAQRGLPVTPAPESYVPKVIGPAWTPPPGWVHTIDGWNPPGTLGGVRTPMPVGYETYRPDGSSTNTPYAPGTTSQAYNNAQTTLGGTAAPWPVSTGGIGQPNPTAPAFGQQPVNNGNGGIGQPNPTAPAFGQQPVTTPAFGQQPPPSGYTNAPGGFGHAALLPNTGQQPVNNGNGGFGPSNPSAPAFGQQPDSSAYESKYQKGVTDIALRGAQKQADLLKQQNAMGSIGRGTFGGARQALMQTEGDYNNAQNLAAIQAMGSQAGFQNAQQQFNADRASNIGVQTQNQNVALQQQQLAQQGQQFQAGLGRDIGLAGLNAGIGSSTNLGNLSAAQQQGDLARLQMQGATAAQQQALQQQINDRNMQNYYTAQQYPMQQLDRYGNILRGGQGAMGTVGTTTTPQGSIGAQLMGAGIAGLGLYGQNAQAINNGVGNIVSGVSNWWNNI